MTVLLPCCECLCCQIPKIASVATWSFPQPGKVALVMQIPLQLQHILTCSTDSSLHMIGYCTCQSKCAKQMEPMLFTILQHYATIMHANVCSCVTLLATLSQVNNAQHAGSSLIYGLCVSVHREGFETSSSLPELPSCSSLLPKW